MDHTTQQLPMDQGAVLSCGFPKTHLAPPHNSQYCYGTAGHERGIKHYELLILNALLCSPGVNWQLGHSSAKPAMTLSSQLAGKAGAASHPPVTLATGTGKCERNTDTEKSQLLTLKVSATGLSWSLSLQSNLPRSCLVYTSSYSCTSLPVLSSCCPLLYWDL